MSVSAFQDSQNDVLVLSIPRPDVIQITAQLRLRVFSDSLACIPVPGRQRRSVAEQTGTYGRYWGSDPCEDWGARDGPRQVVSKSAQTVPRLCAQSSSCLLRLLLWPAHESCDAHAVSSAACTWKLHGSSGDLLHELLLQACQTPTLCSSRQRWLEEVAHLILQRGCFAAVGISTRLLKAV